MKILIYGLGGHGFEPLGLLLNNPNIIGPKGESNSIHFLQSPSDYGGATGLICRLFNHDNRFLDRRLHGNIPGPNFPWGDYNQLIGFYIGLRHPECKEYYLTRCNNLQDLVDHFQNFAICIDADSDFRLKFELYVAEIFEYSANIGFKIENISVAHFFNSFLFSICGSMEKFNQFYQDLDILPSNCFLHFISSSRLVLQAKNILGHTLIGEDEIDLHDVPIAPQSFKITYPNGKNLSQEEIKIATDLIDSCDYIIFPNGSDANRHPITNIPEIAESLAKKSDLGRVIQFMNLFRKSNEVEFYVTTIYHKSLGIAPFIIGPETPSHVNNDLPLLRTYGVQEKFANPPPVNIGFYFNLLKLVKGNKPGPVEGVKYTPESIIKALKKIMK
jgi:hypothetical protein